MILYFDNYITNEPMHNYRPPISALEKTRNSKAKIYKMSNKEEITLYTLASYKEIKWSKVIIKYELEDPSRKENFEKKMKKIFPKATYIYPRSNTQKKFQESIKLMEEIDDEWIFYAGNNDHPFIAPEIITLKKCLEVAKKMKQKYRFVSIIFSHFPGVYNIHKKGSPFHEINYKNVKKIAETSHCFITKFPRGIFDAVQIVHKELFKHWFFSKDLGDKEVRRSDCLQDDIEVKDQILIIPKNEICGHFDAHTLKDNYPYNIPHSVYPPLFIPPSFFQNRIKIRYGYEKYKENWVNINPKKKFYSFENIKIGTDLKKGIEEIPLFWKKRISKIDINPKLNKKEIQEAIKIQRILKRTPLKEKSFYYYFLYRIKNDFFSLIYKIKFLRNLFYKLKNKISFINQIHDKLKNINHKANNISI